MLHIDYALSPEELPKECIKDCSAPGSVDEAVAYWTDKLGLTVNQDRAKQMLEAYGLDDGDDLVASWDAERVIHYTLWIACGNFRDGEDLFILEG